MKALISMMAKGMVLHSNMISENQKSLSMTKENMTKRNMTSKTNEVCNPR